MPAKDFTFPVATAALSWMDSDGQLHIRVYSSDGYNVTERCQDGSGGWTTGDFKEPGAAVSATCWTSGDGTHVRVYCTYQEKTTEWGIDPGTGWYKGDYTDT